MFSFYSRRVGPVVAWVATLATVCSLTVPPVRAQTPFDELLPGDTLALVRVSDFKDLRARWGESQMGRLLADPAMKPFIDGVLESLDELGAEFQKQAGLSFRDVWQLPQGEAALAVRGPADGGSEPRVIAMMNVGDQVEKTRELLDRLTTKLVDAGFSRKVEQVQGTDLTVLAPPDENKDNDQWPQVVWGLRDAVLIAATDLPTASELLARWDGGAEGTLARKPSYRKIVERTGENAQVHIYADAAALITLLTKSLAGVPAPVGVDQIFKWLGFDSLRSIGGGVAMGKGTHDYELRLLVHYETPPRGLVRAIHFRSSQLTPEPWVPPDAVSYSTVNFDLGVLVNAVEEIVGNFLPGGAIAQAQALLNAQGIDLDLKRELLTPIGRRISTISDFGKSGEGDTERSLFAVALNDAKTANATLAKLAPLSGGAIKPREFQGLTVYDLTLPRGLFPGVDGQADGLPGKIGFCASESYLFIASDVALLEKVLLNASGQKSKLADTPAYKQIARHLPAEAGGMSFSRTAEQYRVLYASLKSGDLADTLRSSLPFLPDWLSRLTRALEGKNLPDFEVIQQYLASGGTYLTTDADGLLIVGFQLRPESP